MAYAIYFFGGGSFFFVSKGTFQWKEEVEVAGRSKLKTSPSKTWVN